MRTRTFSSAIALLLVATLIAPSLLLLAPQKTYAQLSVVEVGANLYTNLKTTVESTITAIESTLSAALDVTSTAAAVALQINAWILQPLAFVLSGNLLKLITAGVIAFVIGKTNGTGVPQFVVDVQKSLQTVADSRALAFFNQFGSNSNSPFARSISSSLRNNYLQKTTLAGFWAANMCTLARTSPNVNAFLAGNWSQGGIASWFALTTQVQNNPYSLYQNSQDQLGTLIGAGAGGATGARLAELGWGQGFGSWCGPSDTTLGIDVPVAPAAGRGPFPVGANPGDACTDKDGNPGVIKTPGSVIAASLNKVLGGQQDQVVRMGNVGPEITGILSNITTVMQTVNFATQLLGGPDSGGLLGIGDTSGPNSTSRLMQYQNSPGNFGVTNAQIYKNAATLPVSGSTMTSQIAQYKTAWDTIIAAANNAFANVTNLKTFCTDAVTAAGTNPDLADFASAASAQASAAQAALNAQIAPVLARAAAASTTIAVAQAMVNKVQAELTSNSESAGGAYAADIQTLQSMSPTMSDVANIQQEAQSFGSAVAIPGGSLFASGGSLLDKMNLIASNAASLHSVCVAPTP